MTVYVLFSCCAARSMAPGRSGVDSYSFDDICVLRSLELPRLLGLSPEFPELSDL